MLTNFAPEIPSAKARPYSGDTILSSAPQTTNVFAVTRDGALLTPPESDGILLGITRETVLVVAAELDIPVRQQSLSLDAVKSAAELFVCSSIRELLPVVSVDGAKIGDGVPGIITLKLLTAFREACRRSVQS